MKYNVIKAVSVFSALMMLSACSVQVNTTTNTEPVGNVAEAVITGMPIHNVTNKEDNVGEETLDDSLSINISEGTEEVTTVSESETTVIEPNEKAALRKLYKQKTNSGDVWSALLVNDYLMQMTAEDTTVLNTVGLNEFRVYTEDSKTGTALEIYLNAGVEGFYMEADIQKEGMRSIYTYLLNYETKSLTVVNPRTWEYVTYELSDDELTGIYENEALQLINLYTLVYFDNANAQMTKMEEDGIYTVQNEDGTELSRIYEKFNFKMSDSPYDSFFYYDENGELCTIDVQSVDTSKVFELNIGAGNALLYSIDDIAAMYDGSEVYTWDALSEFITGVTMPVAEDSEEEVVTTTMPQLDDIIDGVLN